MIKLFSPAIILFTGSLLFIRCNHVDSTKAAPKETTAKTTETPEHFLLRPKVEKEYGYSHAVKIGGDLKISGAVSMDDNGVLVAPGSMDQQMKILL